jgi:hypothetical protein
MQDRAKAIRRASQINREKAIRRASQARNTVAQITTQDKSRIKYEQLLGSEASWVGAMTWQTRAVAYIKKDGSGYVEVRAINGTAGAVGAAFHRFDFGPEAER